MIRLLKIGSGLFVYSIIPILSWIFLAIILDDGRISNVFSIIYSIQFVWAILKSMFGTASNIRKEKENDDNAIWNGIFWGIIFSIILFSIPIIFIDKFILFFGLNVRFYKIYALYGICILFLQTLFSFIIEKLYFEDKEDYANLQLIIFNLISFFTLVISSLIYKNNLITFLIPLIILTIYLIILYCNQYQKFKIKFNFFQNIKYESSEIVTSFIMLFIYLFGFKIAFSTGEEYLMALNLIALCTDTQWDMFSAISTVSKVDIAKNRFEFKKVLFDSYFYVSVIMSSSIIMFSVLINFYDVKFNIAITYLLFQILDMILYAYISVMEAYTQLEISYKLSTNIALILMLIRFLVSIFIISPYCTEIGQVTQGILSFIVYLIVGIKILKSKVI